MPVRLSIEQILQAAFDPANNALRLHVGVIASDPVYHDLTAGGAQEIDLSQGSVHVLSLDSSAVTLSFTGAADGGRYTLVFENTGDPDVTWSGEVLFGAGSDPGLTTNGIDVVTLLASAFQIAVGSQNSETFDLQAVDSGDPVVLTLEIDGIEYTVTISALPAVLTGTGVEPFNVHGLAPAGSATLTVAVDGGMAATVTMAAGPATLLSGNAEPYDLAGIDSGADTSVDITVDGGDPQTVVYTADPAEVVSLVEPFDLDSIDSGSPVTLDFTTDGGSPETVTIEDTDVVDFTAVTASEIATLINTDTTGLTASASDGIVTVRTDSQGTDSSILVEAGSPDANSILGFPTVLAEGDGNVADYSAVTAQEAVDAINAQTTGLTAVVETAKIRLNSDSRGTAKSLDVDAGTPNDANSAFGLSTTLVNGSGDAAHYEAVTAAEIVAVIESDVSGVTASVVTGAVRITTDSQGTDSSLDVAAGATNLNSLVLLPLAPVTGSGDVAVYSAVTAQEVVDAINAVIADSAFTAEDMTGIVALISNERHMATLIQVTGGTMNDASDGLDFPTTEANGRRYLGTYTLNFFT